MPDLFRSAFHTGPLVFDWEGIRFTVPYRDAAGWLADMAGPNWHEALFRLTDDDSYEAFVQLAEDGRADRSSLAALARSALAQAAGRDWWEAERLVYMLHEPTLLGSVMRALRPEGVSLAAFLAVEYSLLVQNASDTDRVRIEAELSVPPPEAVGSDDGGDDMAAMVARARSMPGVRLG